MVEAAFVVMTLRSTAAAPSEPPAVRRPLSSEAPIVELKAALRSSTPAVRFKVSLPAAKLMACAAPGFRTRALRFSPPAGRVMAAVATL